jgi:hypothetical protein
MIEVVDVVNGRLLAQLRTPFSFEGVLAPFRLGALVMLPSDDYEYRVFRVRMIDGPM